MACCKRAGDILSATNTTMGSSVSVSVYHVKKTLIYITATFAAFSSQSFILFKTTMTIKGFHTFAKAAGTYQFAESLPVYIQEQQCEMVFVDFCCFFFPLLQSSVSSDLLEETIRKSGMFRSRNITLLLIAFPSTTSKWWWQGPHRWLRLKNHANDEQLIFKSKHTRVLCFGWFRMPPYQGQYPQKEIIKDTPSRKESKRTEFQIQQI